MLLRAGRGCRAGHELAACVRLDSALVRCRGVRTPVEHPQALRIRSGSPQSTRVQRRRCCGRSSRCIGCRGYQWPGWTGTGRGSGCGHGVLVMARIPEELRSDRDAAQRCRCARGCAGWRGRARVRGTTGRCRCAGVRGGARRCHGASVRGSTGGCHGARVGGCAGGCYCARVSGRAGERRRPGAGGGRCSGGRGGVDWRGGDRVYRSR